MVEQWDLDKYNKIYDIIESYIKTNNLVVYSNIHSNRLYTVFSDNPLHHATTLTNEIFKENEIVEMKTQIPYKSFLITVNFKRIVVFHIIEKYKNIDYIDLIKPIKSDFLLLPPEIELIIVYWKLYQLQEHDNWDKLPVEELSTGWKKRIDEGIIGGNNEINKVIQAGRQQPTKYINILNKILDIVININSVIIGAIGCDIITNNLAISDHSDRIQIISSNVAGTIEEISNTFNVTQRNHELKLPIDFRLKRTTLYAMAIRHGKTVELPIIDIFNSAEYELIPYSHSSRNHLIGHPYVILKFLFIDLWILNLRKAYDNIDAKIYINKARRLSQYISRMQSLSIPIDKVYGIYNNEDIYLKNIYKDAKMYPYVPYRKKKQ